MRKRSTRVRSASGRTRAVLIVTIFAAVGGVALMPVIAYPPTPSREIVLVARDMAFYLEGSDVPNPAIVVKPGTDVRIVVRNEDQGITHGFAVGLHTAIDRIQAGTAASLSFHVPRDRGRHEYVCPPHAQMMTGVLLVTE